MVRADRGRYIASALTICRAYLAAGSPGCLPRLASYGPWSDRVRSALVWLGMANPVETMAQLAADDPVREAQSMVLAAWAGAQRLILATAVSKCPSLWHSLKIRPICTRRCSTSRRSAARALTPPKSTINSRQLAERHANTIAEGHKLIVDRSDKKRPRWRLERVSE